MDAITYSLRGDQPRSDQYYRDIAEFTGEVLARIDRDLGPLLAAFEAEVRASGREAQRTRPEYAFELLVLGVYGQVYGDRALNLPRLPQRTLAALARWRDYGGVVKVAADVLRGALGALFLSHNHHAAESPALTLDSLPRLLDWLAAAGDFEPEVERLRAWQRLLAALPPGEGRDRWSEIGALARWFAARSAAALGGYTPHVDRFLQETHPRYRWREDYVFCGRQRVEYHLNMVGTEIMNRAFRESFLSAGRKVVLVPPCMRFKSADECQARSTPLGERCAGCEPKCRVHQITKLGEKHGFAVFMLPRELASLKASASTQEGMAGLGIVGVSCPLTNPQGGWKARDMDLPAQGLLLDYCGCSWHWHLDGAVPTDLNFHQLLRVLDLPDAKGG